MKTWLIALMLLTFGFCAGAEWKDKWGHTMKENEAFHQGATWAMWDLSRRWHESLPDDPAFPVQKPTWNVKEWSGFVHAMGWDKD